MLVMLKRQAGGRWQVIVKLNHKLNYIGHMCFKPVWGNITVVLLEYLKYHNYRYKDIIVLNTKPNKIYFNVLALGEAKQLVPIYKDLYFD